MFCKYKFVNIARFLIFLLNKPLKNASIAEIEQTHFAEDFLHYSRRDDLNDQNIAILACNSTPGMQKFNFGKCENFRITGAAFSEKQINYICRSHFLNPGSE